jgi:hypothetical protein
MKNTLIILSLTLTLFVKGQNKQNLLKDLNQDDSTALLTLVTFPDSIRTTILTACQKPDFLIKTESLQKNSSKSFRDLIDNYNKEEQKKIWDISRYPGLISKITTGGKKTKDELDKIASNYPKEIQPTILEYGTKHFETLAEINNFEVSSNAEFEKIIVNYPEETKNHYRSLLSHPDILNTLATNMHLSVILGNLYTTSPKQTLQLFDSIKVEQEKQTAKNQEDWKNGLEKNPEAKKELEKVANEFITDKEPDSNVDDVYYSNSSNSKPQTFTQQPIINQVVYPYPYWFGYPWWYDYPYWYPYPYWYNFGFYWGPSGIVTFGMPSPYFMHWYFFHPYHHYYYSNFSNYCLDYHYSHYGPRDQRTGFNSEIRNWTRANEPNLPRGYLRISENRQTRIKELGRFEMNYHDNTKGVFGKNITRTEFLQNNPTYYPNLNSVITQPSFNKRINYPPQQAPIRFNMGGNNPVPSQRQFNNPPSQPVQRGGGGNGGGGGTRRR